MALRPIQPTQEQYRAAKAFGFSDAQIQRLGVIYAKNQSNQGRKGE